MCRIDLFVVLIDGMTETEVAVRVFSTSARAHECLKTLFQGRGRVYRRTIQAEAVPTTVFAAHRYDRGPDLHHFVGLYANYIAARAAGGQQGHYPELPVDGE